MRACIRSLGRGKHYHIFGASAKAAFRRQSDARGRRDHSDSQSLWGHTAVHRNVRFVDGVVDSGGRTTSDPAFVDVFGGCPLGQIGGSDIHDLPRWVRRLSQGRSLVRTAGAPVTGTVQPCSARL
jgi:hypothetical protein